MRTIEEVIAELRNDIHSDVYLGKKTINTYLDEILEIHKAERPINEIGLFEGGRRMKKSAWHPFTEEPKDECQYLVQHFYKSWSGHIFITFEVVDSLEELIGLINFNKKNGNRDNHYQAWQKIEPYEEDRE